MKDFKRYLNESRSRKLNEASSMKFGEKGWKSVIESTKPKDYKEGEVEGHFSYIVQVDNRGVFIELDCNYRDPDISDASADNNIEENYNALVDWKEDIIKTLNDKDIFGFNISNIIQLKNDVGYRTGESWLQISIRE